MERSSPRLTDLIDKRGKFMYKKTVGGEKNGCHPSAHLHRLNHR